MNETSVVGGFFGLEPHLNRDDLQGKYEFLGRLNASWNTLDYILRLALKRIRGVSINSEEADKIFRQPHGTLIDKLLSEYSGNQDVVEEINKVGRSRDGSEFYGQRNKYFHAVWAIDSTGQEVYQRVGGNDWRTSVNFEISEIMNLISDIERTAFKIEQLTKSEN